MSLGRRNVGGHVGETTGPVAGEDVSEIDSKIGQVHNPIMMKLSIYLSLYGEVIVSLCSLFGACGSSRVAVMPPKVKRRVSFFHLHSSLLCFLFSMLYASGLRDTSKFESTFAPSGTSLVRPVSVDDIRAGIYAR